MAQHIDTVESSNILKVNATTFLSNLKTGDYIFCSGSDKFVSVPIEKETGSPFSHVLMVWKPWASSPWLTIESTINKGVHVGLVSDYVPNYEGDLVLAHRPSITPLQVQNELNAMFEVLDDTYNWQSEVTFAANKLLKHFPIDNPKKELYCSGLQQVGTQASPIPIITDGPIMATPEQFYIDKSIVAVHALLQSKK